MVPPPRGQRPPARDDPRSRSRPSTRENPLRAGISREELRSRAGNAQERVFAPAHGEPRSGRACPERPKIRCGLAAHTIRSTAEQQRVVSGVDAEFLRAGAAPPSPEEALGKLGVKGNERHELFQLLVAERRPGAGQGVALLPRRGARDHPGQARRVPHGEEAIGTQRHEGPARHHAASTPSRSWSTSTPSGSRCARVSAECCGAPEGSAPADD